MMLTLNGYSLVYYKSRNQIVIGLPQTAKTPTNTLEPVADRRVDVKAEELAILLNATQFIFLNGTSTWGRNEEDDNIDPYMYPCTMCEDFDGKGGCMSKGGCGERRENAETD